MVLRVQHSTSQVAATVAAVLSPGIRVLLKGPDASPMTDQVEYES